MWSVDNFIDDQSVEMILIHKNKCAWPKNNLKKVKPNKIELNFLKACKLGKYRG